MGVYREKREEKTTTILRKQLEEPGLIVEASSYNPFTARLAERLGFKQVWAAGQGLGNEFCYTENLMTITEYVDFARMITDAINIPLVVDIGCGVEDPLHVMRCVRQMERAGVAGITLDDQIIPKRFTHFTRPMIEYVIPAEKMVLKLKSALEAREDDDFVIMASSHGHDAVGGSFEEYLRRLKLYEEAGVDLIRSIPQDIDILKKVRSEVSIPLGSGLSRDIKPGVRGKITPKVLEELGYKIARTTLMSQAVQYRATRELFNNILNDRPLGLTNEEYLELTADMLETIGVPKLIDKELIYAKPPYKGKIPY